MLRPILERKQRAAHRFASAFTPRTTPGLWTRNKMSTLLANRYLGDWLIQRQLQDDFPLPQYAF
jgi:hypothetical protein